ncbi:tripartite motif-containing protein 3 [Cherax quadricarinatus]
MVMFDKCGAFRKVLKSDSALLRPSAVVQLQDGCIAVKDRASIFFFDSEGGFASSIGCGSLQKPYGLCIDDEGKLLTIEAHSHGSINVLTICPQKRSVVAKMAVDLGLSFLELQNSKPRFLMWYQKEEILVVDLGLNCINVINYKNGKLLYKFGENGFGHGQFSDPAGITSDSYGNIYIADSRNHRIQVFDSSLNFTCILLTDCQLVRPSGIFITPDDDLLVINYWEHTVAKFSLTSKISYRELDIFPM